MVLLLSSSSTALSVNVFDFVLAIVVKLVSAMSTGATVDADVDADVNVDKVDDVVDGVVNVDVDNAAAVDVDVDVDVDFDVDVDVDDGGPAKNVPVRPETLVMVGVVTTTDVDVIVDVVRSVVVKTDVGGNVDVGGLVVFGVSGVHIRHTQSMGVFLQSMQFESFSPWRKLRTGEDKNCGNAHRHLTISA